MDFARLRLAARSACGANSATLRTLLLRIERRAVAMPARARVPNWARRHRSAMRNHIVAIVALLVVAAPVHGADLNELHGEMLARHTRATGDVAGTRVDYRALREEPRWKDLLAALADAVPPDDERDAQLAYWINAYNILAIDVVVQNDPAESIRDVGSLLRPVWKKTAGTAGGRSLSLDEIEHAILRPMGEPRIHMAIVCASTSCPSLAREPYAADRLDAQLDAAARSFVASPEKGAAVEAQSLRLSRIFDWFGKDFAATGGVVAFVRRHAGPALGAKIDALGSDPKLVWFDYDWSLNGIGRPSP
jgi:hypothetical protein